MDDLQTCTAPQLYDFVPPYPYVGKCGSPLPCRRHLMITLAKPTHAIEYVEPYIPDLPRGRLVVLFAGMVGTVEPDPYSDDDRIFTVAQSGARYIVHRNAVQS